MKAFLPTREQVTGIQGAALFAGTGFSAPATDLARLTMEDDGFVLDASGAINWYLAPSGCVSRLGRVEADCLCAVRVALALEPGEQARLSQVRASRDLTRASLGVYPQRLLDSTLRDMAQHEFDSGTLPETGRHFTLPGGFAGFSREAAEQYLRDGFLSELLAAETETAPDEQLPFRVGEHDELSLMRAYIEANIPVFLHGLSGDGKSDRVRQLDPQALDIELVNETPETINGRAIYNEAKDEIRDVKPVWLLQLEELCQDGKLHILFFDELTNATKQTQSVIFKIVLERIVNNRWPLPENARIIAAGNDRAESTVAHDLAEPLFGRFAHLYIRTTVENWMPWAVRHSINPYILEFLANNDLYLRTPYTGTEPNADPRRWELASRVLDSSGNDFSLLAPLVGEKTADAFVKFFRAQRELGSLGAYTDAELQRFSAARKYQLAQQCLYLAAAKPAEARALVARLGAEYAAWFDYVLRRKQKM